MQIEFEKVIEFFNKSSDKSKEEQIRFVDFVLGEISSNASQNGASEVMCSLLDAVDNDLVYDYLLDKEQIINEDAVAKAISVLPTFCSQEIIETANNKLSHKEISDRLNINVVLASYINNYRNDSDDFEQKVKNILSCINKDTKELRQIIKEKNQEIQYLKGTINEFISAEKMLSEIRSPLTALEKYIAIEIHNNQSNEVQYLIDIADDFRKVLSSLYGIDVLFADDLWKKQTPIRYNADLHELKEKNKEQLKDSYVTVYSRGFRLKHAGKCTKIRAEVRLKDTGLGKTSPNPNDENQVVIKEENKK